MVYSLEIDSSDPMNDLIKENSLIHFLKIIKIRYTHID